MKHMFDRAIMTKADLLLLAVSCGAAVLFALLLALFGRGGERVRILYDGRLTGEYSLHEDRQIPLHTEKGENLLVIRDGEAWIEEADCPDGLCIRQQLRSEYLLQHLIVFVHRPFLWFAQR